MDPDEDFVVRGRDDDVVEDVVPARALPLGVGKGIAAEAAELFEALAEARWVFVTVGTPPREDGSTDLSYVEEAVRTVGQNASNSVVIAIKSTVPVGTADRAREILSELGREDIAVVSNPEFLREGQAVRDFTHPIVLWSVAGRPKRAKAW